MHARRDDHLIGIDVDAVATLVPRHDRIDDHALIVEVTPVLVLHTVLDGLGDGRRGAEIHIGDAHADFDAALAVQADLAIEFRGVGAEAVVDLVEVELALERFRGAPVPQSALNRH